MRPQGCPDSELIPAVEEAEARLKEHQAFEKLPGAIQTVLRTRQDSREHERIRRILFRLIFRHRRKTDTSATATHSLPFYFLISLLLHVPMAAAVGIQPEDMAILSYDMWSRIFSEAAVLLEAFRKGKLDNPEDRHSLMNCLIGISMLSSGLAVTSLYQVIAGSVKDALTSLELAIGETTPRQLVADRLQGLLMFLDMIQDEIFGEQGEHLAKTTSYWLHRLNAPLDEDKTLVSAKRDLLWLGKNNGSSEDARLFPTKIRNLLRYEHTGSLVASPPAAEQAWRLLGFADSSVHRDWAPLFDAWWPVLDSEMGHATRTSLA